MDNTEIAAKVSQGQGQESEESELHFTDGCLDWMPVHAWVRFLIQIGYSWHSAIDRTRRVGLVSMPCDSAGAGLIALGSLRKRLEISGANDRAAHFERIRIFATQSGNGIGILDQRNRGKKRGPYFLEGQFSEDLLWACLRDDPRTRVSISPSTAKFWQFSGEPPIEILDGESLPFVDIYSSIPGTSGKIFAENLDQSDSDICLAGRTTGDAGTRRVMSDLQFRGQSGTVASLAQLLTIHEWQGDTVSRIAFFNTRTKSLDRPCPYPRLVLADGEHSFLEALQRFPKTDVIGVINRSADREKLESVWIKLSELTQWFEGDEELAQRMPIAPRGIAFSILKARM
jgi:hypothetical protein